MARGSGEVLGVFRGPRVLSGAAIASLSTGELDRRLALPAELGVVVASDEALFVGAFGRAPGDGLSRAPHAPRFRRGSGGPAVALGPGTVHVSLSLAHPGALVPCDEKRIVNRYVRPLLRAITSTSRAQAHYFGRDWVSLAHRPVAWVGFAHDASSRRTLFEAFVAVRTPFAREDGASFRGHAPATLEEIAGKDVDAGEVAQAIVAAYARDAEVVPLADEGAPIEGDARAGTAVDATPWRATREEAIGRVGAGPDASGVFRLGGDLMASRDAIARLEARVADGTGRTVEELGRLVDEALAAPGVALEGVRSLTSLRDAIAEALSSSPSPRSSPP